MVQYGVPEIRCHIACPRESLRALRPRRTRRPSAPSTAHQGTLGAETAGAPRPAGLPVHASLYKGLLGLDTSMRSVNLAAKFRLFDEHWSPKIVGDDLRA